MAPIKKYEFAGKGRATLRIAIERHADVLMPSAYAAIFAELLVRKNLKGKLVLDVGCGSGILSIVAAKCGARVWATDICPAALEMTKRNAVRNKVKLERTVSSNALDIFLPGKQFAKKRFHLIICNHPSLPGKGAQDLDREGFREWNQNGSGRLLLDEVLEHARQLLSPTGSMMTHSSSEQGWDVSLKKLSAGWADWKMHRLIEQSLSGDYYGSALKSWINERRVYRKRGKWVHSVMFLEAFARARRNALALDSLSAEA